MMEPNVVAIDKVRPEDTNARTSQVDCASDGDGPTERVSEDADWVDWILQLFAIAGLGVAAYFLGLYL